jgi:hypothetical protein
MKEIPSTALMATSTSSKHWRTLAGSMGGLSNGDDAQAIADRTSYTDRGECLAQHLVDELVDRLALCRGGLRWYNSSSTVTVGSQVTPSISQPHLLIGARPSLETIVTRLPSRSMVTGQPTRARLTHPPGPSTIPSCPEGGRARSDSLWRGERTRTSTLARSLPRRVTLKLGPDGRVLRQELLHSGFRRG